MNDRSLDALEAYSVNDGSDMKEAVYVKLKEMIMKREFTPNERIDPLEISRKMGISRTPVRDALNTLNSEGFITIMPRQGIYVKGVYKRDLIELFQYRKMVELFAVDIGFENLRENIPELNQIIFRINTLLESDNYSGSKIMEEDITFHKIIVESSRNKRIIDSYIKLNGHVQMARAYYLQDLNRIKLADSEHQKIVYELTRGNKDATKVCLQEHLDQTLANLLKIIDVYKVF